MSEVILLRKMAYKSIFQTGIYAGMSVQQVMDLKKQSYLKWVYFNQSDISFIDEILDYLHISGEYLIKKPGTNPNLLEKLYHENYDKMSPLLKHIYANKKKTKKRLVEKKIILNRVSKAKMQSVNHGR